MKSAGTCRIVLVTAPDLKVARRLARAALRARLVACVTLVPRIESHYWWREKIECGSEVLLVMKTTRARLKAIETLVLAGHPYDTPEVLVLPTVGGSRKYLNWLEESCAIRQRRKDQDSVRPLRSCLRKKS